ncbi:MAG: type II secretion system F family protein [Actinomycetota bacterium]|nr:type II secretion system F family protein [Actinomycetota bacterium]
MSELYLALALTGTFAAIMLFGFAVDFGVSERRRAVRLLESQVGQLAPVRHETSLRQKELSRSFVDRTVNPFVLRLGRAVRRFTPLDTRERIAGKLSLAGSPVAWDAERVAALKLVGGVAGFILGLFLASFASLSGAVSIVLMTILTAVGFLAPDAILNRKVEARQKDIRNSLPDILDLLTISVEAGLSLNAALAQVVQNVPGTLSSEVSRMLQEIQIGSSRADAFRHLAERTDVDELNAFVLAMIQADIFGVSISNVLRGQSKELRIKRRQRAEKAAQQTPVKIVFPLILCVLPSLFIVVIGPGAIRIFQNLLHA